MKVAVAPNENSALMTEGVLNNAGIPSLTQRARGFDAPDLSTSARPLNPQFPAYSELPEMIMPIAAPVVGVCC